MTDDRWRERRHPDDFSEYGSLFEPTLVQGPNEGEHNDLASFISADGCRLYFDRDFPVPIRTPSSSSARPTSSNPAPAR